MKGEQQKEQKSEQAHHHLNQTNETDMPKQTLVSEVNEATAEPQIPFGNTATTCRKSCRLINTTKAATTDTTAILQQTQTPTQPIPQTKLNQPNQEQQKQRNKQREQRRTQRKVGKTTTNEPTSNEEKAKKRKAEQTKEEKTATKKPKPNGKEVKKRKAEKTKKKKTCCKKKQCHTQQRKNEWDGSKKIAQNQNSYHYNC
jgi:hypothetical protein